MSQHSHAASANQLLSGDPSWVDGREAGHRVDPRALDRRHSFALSGKRYALDGRGATVHGHGGLSAAIRPHEFEGVTARAAEDEDGRVIVTLELMHADKDLSVPLLVADNLDDVAADWRDWARMFRLPMLMVEADGSIESLESVMTSHDRRPRASKRPRFLLRRRTASLGVAMRIQGREIIARN